MLGNADVAMDRAKRSGRGSYVEYEQGMRTAIVSRLEVATSLRGAVTRGASHAREKRDEACGKSRADYRRGIRNGTRGGGAVR